MSLFLPSQLSPNFEEVIEGNDLEFRFLVNTNGSEITSYKLEILNENNDAETPDENILYTQRGDFASPLYNQDEGLITVFYSDVENILIPGHNYRWRVRLYDAQVFNNDEPPTPNVSVDDIQSEALSYMGSGNLVGTTRNVIWLNNPIENIQEEDFVEMYLQSNDFSNDFKPFINDSQTYTKEGTDGLSIIDDGKYCWIPAGVPDINSLILPNYQDKLCDGNMYFQIAENIIEGLPIYLDTDCILTNMDLFITILNLEDFKADENETVYQFGIQVNLSSWPWDNILPQGVYIHFRYVIIEDGEPVQHDFNASIAHNIPVAEDRMLQLYLLYKTDTDQEIDQSLISDMPFNENIEQISLTSSYRSQSLYKVAIDDFYDSSLLNGMYAFRFAFEYGLPGGAQIWFYNSSHPTQLVCKITIAESDNTLAEEKDLRVWYFSINNTKDASFFFASPVYPYIPRQILTSRVIIDNQNNRHFYFGISKKQSLTQWVPSSSTGQRYKYKLVYLERQEIFGITSGIGTNSLTKIETDKPFTYNASHGEMINAPLTNNHFYANKLYIQPIDEFDSKDVGNVYLICSNTLDGLALTHSYNYMEYASFIRYSQQQMEHMGAKKIINYVAETGEITLFSNLDDIPDLFSLYQIFTIDKTLSDYAINPKYKILSGSLVYIKNGVRYLEDRPNFSSASFRSFPYYLGGKAVYKLGRSPMYIYNEGFNETGKIIDGSYLRGDSSVAVYSNHFDNVARWQATDDSYQMLTYKMFVQPNNTLKEDYYAPCVLNLYKTFDQDTENIYGYATNSFIQSEYNKYLSIDHLDESQYLITYTTYNSILNGSKYQIKNTVVFPQSGNNYYHYYIVLNTNGQLEEGDTCVVCLQYGFSGSGNLGDDIWFRDQDGTPIGRTPLWTPNRPSYPPGLYQIEIISIDGEGDSVYHISLLNEWTYSGTDYNTQDLNKMIFPQTPYKLYSYFVDSIPEQFFYYRPKREISLSYKEAFTGQENVVQNGDDEILWSGVYVEELSPIKGYANEAIAGGTIVWNQLRPDDASDYHLNGVGLLLDNQTSVIITRNSEEGIATRYARIKDSIIANHIYLIGGYAKAYDGASHAIMSLRNISGGGHIEPRIDGGTSGLSKYVMVQAPSQSNNLIYFCLSLENGAPLTSHGLFKNVICCDLTKMFGIETAEYVYQLEQGNTGAGMSWLHNYGFFTRDYYSYNSGEVVCVNTSKHITGEDLEYQYQLDEGLFLNGELKLTEVNNNGEKELYYDGDVYYSDGTVNRKFTQLSVDWLEWEYDTDLQLYKSQSLNTDTTMCPQFILDSETPVIYTDEYQAVKIVDVASSANTIGIRYYPPYNPDTQQYPLSYSFEIKTDNEPSGFFLTYKLQVPYEQAYRRPYTNPQYFEQNQICKYIDYQYAAGQRDIEMPVGHITTDASKIITVRDIMVQGAITSENQIAFSIPAIKYYQYQLYAQLNTGEQILLQDSGHLYDGKLTYTFYGLDSIYEYNSYIIKSKDNRIRYIVQLIIEDEYGFIEKKTEEFFAKYYVETLSASLTGVSNCQTQSIELSYDVTSLENKSQSLYKKRPNQKFYDYHGTYLLSEIEDGIADYNLLNGKFYEYELWEYHQAESNYGMASSNGGIHVHWQDWSLCDLVYDYNNKIYIPGDTVFLFRNNINSGSINKNIGRIQYETLNQYNRILSTAQKYESGNLTCLFGDFRAVQKIGNNKLIITLYGEVPTLDNQSKKTSFLTMINSLTVLNDANVVNFYRQNGFPHINSGDSNPYLGSEYSNTILYVEDIKENYDKYNNLIWKPLSSRYQFISDIDKVSAYINCLSNKQKKLLKAPNGNSWIVSITGNPSRDIDWKSGAYPTNVSFDWQEVEDINSAIILKW